MAEDKIQISYSPNYASGFQNVAVGLDEFAALQGVRLYHAFDEDAIKRYADNFYYGRSCCYNILRVVSPQNQFTGDLLSRKILRKYLWFQYVFFDLIPNLPLKALIRQIKLRPNIVSTVRNRSFRFFYILDSPHPLTGYKQIYGRILPFLAGFGDVMDVSTPKVIRADRGVLLHEERLHLEMVTPLF